MSETYLGVDVHKRICVFTEIDSEGNLLRRGKFSNNFEEVGRFACSLTSNINLVLEPVLNYLWILDQIEPYAGSIHVATPHKVRIIAESKSKTDRYDSRILAELLRTNFLPESWIPPQHIRILRSVVRQRYHLVKMLVMNKNRVRHQLFRHGIDLPVFDISSPTALKKLKRLCIPEVTRRIIDQCLKIIAELKQSIKELEQQLSEMTADVDAVDLLQTIPGVGPVRSATIYAEIGDINRFKNSKALANYTGLIPSVRSSGDSIHTGGITKNGSRPLRHTLVEASINVIKESKPLNRLFHRVLYRGNVQKARVAVARKLAVIVYAMLKRNEPFMLQAA
jgi:transposase